LQALLDVFPDELGGLVFLTVTSPLTRELKPLLILEPELVQVFKYKVLVLGAVANEVARFSLAFIGV
jgi:hypothetical protein